MTKKKWLIQNFDIKKKLIVEKKIIVEKKKRLKRLTDPTLSKGVELKNGTSDPPIGLKSSYEIWAVFL